MYHEMRCNVHKAYVFLRKHNQNIPDEILDLMKDAAFDKIDEMENSRKGCDQECHCHKPTEKP